MYAVSVVVRNYSVWLAFGEVVVFIKDTLLRDLFLDRVSSLCIMASLDHDTPLYNLSGALILSAYVVSALFLTTNITLSLIKIHVYSPGSRSMTKHIDNEKTKLKSLLLIFSALAALSFSTLSYHMLNYLIVSYQAWATNRGSLVPHGLFGKNSILGPDGSISLHIWQCLTTSTLFQDFAQTICGNTARFWWTQQALFVTMAWSMFMSYEGRRREMPKLWAYAFISQILPVSFAQNLFFLAILQTPVPMPEEVVWGPSPIVQFLPLVAYFGFVFLAPYVAGTRAFVPVIFIIRLLLFCPLVLPTTVPSNIVRTHLNVRDRFIAYMGSFKSMGVCAVLLFMFQTAVAVSDHGLSGTLSAINDSPAASALGYDYMLCLVSAFTWVTLVGTNLE